MMEKNEQAAIGIDMGATNLRVGHVENGKLKSLEKEPLPEDKSVENILDLMCEMISSVDNGADRLGIGVPSVVDSTRGIVYDVQNIPGWDKVHLKPLLEERTDKTVFVNNDANCFTLGEYHFGKGSGHSNMVGLTIGTGFAGGVILDAELYEGRNCGAGEFGMVPYKESIFENYCSGQFFRRTAGIPGEEIYQRATENDPEAKRLFQEFGIHLGRAVKMVLYTYDPDCIVFGGSISKGFDQFRDGFEKELSTFGFPKSLEHLEISVSETEHVAVLGAAALTF